MDFTPIAISTKIKEMFQSAGVCMMKNKWPQDSRSNGRKCQKFHGISGERYLVELKTILSGYHGYLIYLIDELDMALI